MKYLLLVCLVLIGCGTDTVYRYTPVPGPTVEVPGPTVIVSPPPLTSEQQTVKIVDEKNIYRLAAGNLPLTRGLTCTVHNVSNPNLTVAWPSAVQTFAYLGNFNQADNSAAVGVNVLPTNLRSMYVNNYGLRCQGQIVILTSGYYLFKLASDDGSMLYIDGSILVNNNFNHGIQTVSNSRLLEKGVHTFRLDYAQTGGGNFALILENSNGLIPEYLFYR